MSGDSDRDPLLVSLLSPVQPTLFVCHVNGPSTSFTVDMGVYIERIKKSTKALNIPSGKIISC